MRNKRFPKYPDDADYNTNSPSYYDDLARKQKLMQLLAERIWDYDDEIKKYFKRWEDNLENINEGVIEMMVKWSEDGTLDHIINDTIFNWKADKTYVDALNENITEQLAQTDKGYKPSWSVWNEFEQRGINVKWLGVKGDKFLEDGTLNPNPTDDYMALRQAIETGYPLYFPPNTHCVIKTALSSPATNKLKIIGSGKSNCSITQAIKDLRVLYVNGDDSEITGISFYGTGVGFPNESVENGALIDFIGKGFIVDNCRFKDADYLSILVKETSGNGKIVNCEFENAWAEEIAYWASEGLIKGNTFLNSENNAIVTRGSNDVIISNNLFKNIGADIDAVIDIRNSYTVPIQTSKRVSIVNNHFVNCYLPLSSTSETTDYHQDIKIEDNIFENINALSYENFIRMLHCKDITFRGNTVKNGGAVRGVSITNSDNVYVSDNIFDTLVGGVLVSANNFIEMSRNTFRNINGVSVQLSNPSSTPNTVVANDNKFFSTNIAIETIGQYVGRIMANHNLFKDIVSMSMKFNYDLAYLETIGNIFLDGEAKAISITAVSTWVKKANTNFDREFGANALIPTNPTAGQLYYNVSTDLYTVYNGTGWLVLGTTRSGNTANRPTTGLSTGTMFYDVTLQQPIWWNGTDWIDATGVTV